MDNVGVAGERVPVAHRVQSVGRDGGRRLGGCVSGGIRRGLG